MKEPKLRTRRQRLTADALRYGIASVAFFALAVVFWFLANPIGLFLLCFASVFTAVAVAYVAAEAVVCRAFERLSRSAAAPFALVSEYGHLVLCGGRAEDVRAYAEYSALTYARMYRLADEKPGREEQQAAKTEQKERLAEEKRLSGALSPFRQFDRFSPADLPFLADKHIFVSERMYRTAASGKDWDAARKKNTVEIVRSPALGR